MGNNVSCEMCGRKEGALVDKTPIDASPSIFEGYEFQGRKSIRRSLLETEMNGYSNARKRSTLRERR
jgi:hypothetical protein